MSDAPRPPPTCPALTRGERCATARAANPSPFTRSYLSDRVVVYSGTPSVESFATAPESLLTGMNKFLASLEITFRRDPTNFRPRINKFGSQLDKEQKANGTYFFTDGQI